MQRTHLSQYSSGGFAFFILKSCSLWVNYSRKARIGPELPPKFADNFDTVRAPGMADMACTGWKTFLLVKRISVFVFAAENHLNHFNSVL